MQQKYKNMHVNNQYQFHNSLGHSNLGGFYYMSRFNENITKPEGNMIKWQSMTKVGSH